MKKLLSLLFVGIMFVACGGDGPDTVVKKYFEAYFIKADVKEAIKYVNFKSEYDKKNALANIIRNAEAIKEDVAKGKFKLISTSVVSEYGNKATVKAVGEFDGRKNSQEIELIKIDNTWYIDSDSLR